MAAIDGVSDHPRPHVIVVGGGLAGLSAAYEAATNNAKVTLIEGEKNVGGNSAKATSGINGCQTEAQKRMAINDSFDRFFHDTMKAGDQENDHDLVDLLVHHSPMAIQFLTQKGVNLNDVTLCGGQSVPRTHRIYTPKEGKPIPVGFTIIKTFGGVLNELASKEPDRIQINTSTLVTELLTENGRVVGVKIQKDGQESEIRADTVILTTGGFSNDHEQDSLLREFASDKTKFPTTNGNFAKGTGVKIARAIGAKLIDMDQVQIHPTGFVDPKAPADTTKFLAAEALRGSGGLLLDHRGARFANELGRRDDLTEAIMTKCQFDPEVDGHTAFLVMNEKAIDLFGWPNFGFYWKIKGFFTKVDNASELVEKYQLDEEIFRQTIERYNQQTTKDEFNKTIFPVKYSLDEPFYVSKIVPSIHYTMGGLKMDPQGRVVSNETGRPIAGLMAAGEVTGGVHGKNRLGGNSLLECVVFGRIAGKNAAASKA
jgi:cleavage and polyadenylation specificity factor subunit 2